MQDMMARGSLRIARLCLVSAIAACAVPACGSSEEGSSGGGTGGAVLGGAGGSGGTSGSGGGGGTGAISASGATGGTAGADAASCPAALPSGWLPTPLKPPDVKVGSCTPEHISEYIAKCGQIDESPCAGFAASGDSAKQTCEACIWSDLTDATWGAAVTLESGSSNLNQAGCIVLDKGSSGGECGKALWDQMHCSTRACSACPESKDCYTDAKLGVCKGYFDQVKTLCQQVQTPCVLGVDGGLPVEYVIDVFCGKGVAGQDGGPDAAADAG